MPYIVAIYAALILIGGFIGHIKAGSTMSLIMGLIFGAILTIAAIGMFLRRKWGVKTALSAAIVLDAFFTYRYLSSMKFLPSGLLSLVSLGVIILLIFHLRRNVK
jgi:uncharacterized membrane protein (UPF0136 family)